MKTERNILIAFLLNLGFSIFEIIGGFLTGSIAISTDAIHDFGDAISIGISFLLEKKSNKKPDNKYTFGYRRYSIIGAFITTMILTTGSILMIIESIKRLINPIIVKSNQMIIIAIIGVIINFIATYVTHGGKSLNQRSVNIHMLEDVLGWIIVLIGSIIMKFTNLYFIDSIMSILVSCFILYHASKNMSEILDLVLEKTPDDIDIKEIKKKIEEIDSVIEVHHIHVWSLDSINNLLTMHVVTNTKDEENLKKEIRKQLKKLKINHSTLELEKETEKCDSKQCNIKTDDEI